MLAPASISHSFSPSPFLLCLVAYSLPGLARPAPLSASHFSYPFPFILCLFSTIGLLMQISHSPELSCCKPLTA